MSEEEQVEETQEELEIRLNKLHERNVGLEAELIKLGVSPNPAVIYAMRFNLLLSFLMNDRVRAEFEIESARNIENILMTIHQRVLEDRSKSKLLIPDVTLPPGIKF